MFDDNDFDCDCGGDEGERYGCDRCECCEDCPHLFECDGCGNLIYKSEAKPPRSPLPQKKKGEASSPARKQEQRSEAPQEPPEKSPKRTAAIVVGALFLFACLLIGIFI